MLHIRTAPMGLKPLTTPYVVPPGDEVTLSNTVQVDFFQPEQVVIPKSIAEYWQIVDVVVGTRSQRPALADGAPADPIAASKCTEDGYDGWPLLHTARLGHVIRLVLRNVSKVHQTPFGCCIIGTAVDVT